MRIHYENNRLYCLNCKEQPEYFHELMVSQTNKVMPDGSYIDTKDGEINCYMCPECDREARWGHHIPTGRAEGIQMILELGRTLAAPGALRALEEAGEPPEEFLARHEAGDWGTVEPEDQAENELSLREGFRILSAYILSTGVKIWVITEADRSATTILLPEEY